MKYKERVLELVRLYLGKTHRMSEIDKMLGNWNNASYREEREQLIEDTIQDIKNFITQEPRPFFVVDETKTDRRDDGLDQ